MKKDVTIKTCDKCGSEKNVRTVQIRDLWNGFFGWGCPVQKEVCEDCRLLIKEAITKILDFNRIV